MGKSITGLLISESLCCRESCFTALWKCYGKCQWNFHCFRICRHPNNIRKGDQGTRVYLKGEQQAVSVVSCWWKPKLFWCRRLWGSRWPHRGVTEAAGCHARMRPVEQKPIYILKSLTVCKQSVLHQRTSSVQLTSVLPSNGTVISRVRVVHMSRRGPLRVFTGVSN